MVGGDGAAIENAPPSAPPQRTQRTRRKDPVFFMCQVDPPCPPCPPWWRVSVVESLAPEIARNLFRRERPGSAVESGSGMRARATHIKVADRRRIACKTEQRARDEQLIERELAVEDVTAGQAVRALEIQRCDHLARHDRRFEAGRIACDRASRGVAEAIALGVPGRAAQ